MRGFCSSDITSSEVETARVIVLSVSTMLQCLQTNQGRRLLDCTVLALDNAAMVCVDGYIC